MSQKSPQLLSDEPSDEDKLGGVHKRIASAIAALFTTSKGGKSVRIDGEWGAGKSTIVRMLMEELEQTTSTASQGPTRPEFSVFLYDAWVHSGDPLKHAFFRALLDKLEQRTWLKPVSTNGHVTKNQTREYWNEQLDILSSRVKRSEKRDTPKFTRNARYAMALIAAFGAGLPYLLKFLGYVEQYIGPLAIGLLVVVVSFIIVWRMPESALNYFLLRNSDTKKTETRGEFAPSSIDFQDVFGTLMTALMQGNERRLVIIVDNLDRIGEGEIKDIWGLLRSFLDNPSFACEKWFERLWVVVPIANANRLGPSMAGQNGPQNGMNTFLEKVFQVRFTLPPPMLHSWKSYMRHRLVEAFGDEMANEYEDIQRIYDVHLTQPKDKSERKTNGQGQPPTLGPRFVPARVTPREIVSLVNDLVAMRLEYGSEISLPLLAAYRLAATSGEKDENGLPILNGRTKLMLKIERLDDAWAMLHFHAKSLDDASYIVTYPVVDKALQEGDVETIKSEVAKGAGASYILYQYIHDTLPDLKGISLLRTAYVVQSLLEASIEGTSSTRLFSESTISHFKTTVQKQIATSANLNVGDKLIVEGVSTLFKILPTDDETARLVVHLLSNEAIAAHPQQGLAPREWDLWLGNLTRLVSLGSLSQLLRSDDSVKLKLRVNEQEWVRLMARFCDAEHEWLLHSIRPASPAPLQIDQWFARYILSNQAQEDYERALHYYFNDSSHFARVSRSLVALCQVSKGPQTKSDESVSQGSALAGLTKLLAISHEGMRALLRSWLESDAVNGFISEARANKDTSSVAKWALIALWAVDGVLPATTSSAVITRNSGPRMRGATTQTAPQPRWVSSLTAFFSHGNWPDELDTKDLTCWIVRLRLFDLLGHPQIVRNTTEKVLWPLAKSEALREHLRTTGLTIEDFASQHVKPAQYHEKFVAEYKSRGFG